MVYPQTRICPGKWDAQNSLGFWDPNRSPNPDQKTKPSDSQKKKKKKKKKKMKENLLNSGFYCPGGSCWCAKLTRSK